jgi:hypothetical protein
VTRPVVYTPEVGPAITLNDLAAFVAEAIGKGIPGRTPVRATGVLELNIEHGPRIARVTVLPAEAPEEATP